MAAEKDPTACLNLERKSTARYILRDNASSLAKTISFNEILLENLREKEVLSQYYFNQAKERIKQKLDDMILYFPFPTNNYLEDILKALRETKQIEAAVFLEEGCRKWKESKIENPTLLPANIVASNDAFAYSPELMALLQMKRRNEQPGQESNLLHLAVAAGDMEVIKYLIESGFDVNSNLNGDLPFHVLGLLSNNTVEVTKMLLRNGVNVKAKNRINNTVAHNVCRLVSPAEYHEWMEYMIEVGHGSLWFEKGNFERTPIHTAVHSAEVSAQSLCLLSSRLNFDFNMVDVEGSTVLMLAASGGQSKSVLECIIKLGGDWRRRNNIGKTVLHFATEAGNIEAVHFFISLGADPNATDINGNAALHFLKHSWLNHKEITKILLANNADIVAKNISGDTAAHQFGRTSDKMEDYLDWKKFLIDSGYLQLFQERNLDGEVPF